MARPVNCRPGHVTSSAHSPPGAGRRRVRAREQVAAAVPRLGGLTARAGRPARRPAPPGSAATPPAARTGRPARPASAVGPAERGDVPHQDRVRGQHAAQRLTVAVADLLAGDHPADGAPQQPPERAPPWIVQADDQVGTGQRNVPPPVVRPVDDPAVPSADLLDPAALLGDRHLDPARLPEQVVHRIPGQSRGVRPAAPRGWTCRSRTPRRPGCDAVRSSRQRTS